MIKINLAQKKAAVTVEDEEQLTSNVRYSDRLDGLRDLPLKKIAVGLGVLLIGSFGLNQYKERELEKIDVQIAQLQKKNRELQAEETKIKGFEQTKNALEADEKMIRDKLRTVTELISDRETPPKLLIALAESLPKDVWVEDFSLKAGEVSIKGYAVSYNQISDFMQNFGRSAYFADIQLEKTEQGKDSLGTEVATFEIQAKRRVQN